MDKELVKDIAERLRECADDLLSNLHGDDDDLEGAVDEVQGLLKTAARELSAMLN